MHKKIVIEVKELNKDFTLGQTKNQVLKDINFEVDEGSFTVIMGSSGSGKSTLLYSISGLDSITSGEVYINQRNITKFSEKEKAKFRQNEIGFVYQGINLIPDLTVFENIAIVGYLKDDKKKVDYQVQQLLEEVELGEYSQKFPNQLSGGQQQRIAIVRSLINHPSIIFADEPTGALNSKSSARILNLLNKLNDNGQTVVMVTHDPKAAARCDQLIYLSDGKITASKFMGKFSEEDKLIREENVLSFLKTQGW
ncbi:ABC transporter ATP-binding protein [Lactovum odontotermitis]